MNSSACEGSSHGVEWFKSSHSSDEGGNCLEVAMPSGAVRVRDSKHLGGPVLTATPAAWAAFVRFTGTAR